MTERRAFMTKLAASGLAMTVAASARCQPAAAASPDARNVRVFGAKGDGRTDDTAAFNAATSAAASADRSAGLAIYVPPGTYRIDGTVFVRKGQALLGAGDATIIDASRARGRTIVMGRDAKDSDDPGGAPASIARLRFLGGSGQAPLIQAGLPGFAITDLFISAAGTAIEIGGADGIISNIVIDQALNGLVLKGARNVIVTGLIAYQANYAITIDSGTGDVSLSDLVLAYSKHASVLFAEGATEITSVRVANASFVSNIEYPTFVGHVHARASGFDAHFAGCTFRNWREFAVTQAAGTGADLLFSDCTFDGARSHRSYNASATASGVRTGADGRIRLNQCVFRHLPGPVALIGPGLRELTIDGGLIADCRGEPIRFVPGAGGRIRVRGTDGFGRRIKQDGTSGIVLPWWGPTTAWRVSAARSGTPGGLTIATVAACQNGAVVACSVSEAQRHGAALPIACGFGTARGGPQQIPMAEGHGSMCVSAPGTGIDWAVDTVI